MCSCGTAAPGVFLIGVSVPYSQVKENVCYVDEYVSVLILTFSIGGGNVNLHHSQT
jgi:hypothetical protein